MSERSSLLVVEQAPLDSDLHDRYQGLSLATPAIYNQLKVPKTANQAQRDRFFGSARRYNPDFRATNLNEEELQQQLVQWFGFLSELKVASLDPDIKESYRWATNEAIANTKMAQVSANSDMRAFKAYNEFIYGPRDPEVFAAGADWFRQTAASFVDHARSEVSQAAVDVLELVPDMGGDRNLLIPPVEVFEAVRNQHFAEYGFFTLLLTGVELPSEDKVPKEIGDVAIRQALRNIGSGLQIMDVDGSAFSVNRHKGAVESPKSYTFLLKRFVGLPLGHEVGHELEYQNGLRQALRLFATGLDRYENGNEGRALVREQLQYPAFEDFAKTVRWQDIMRRQFAVSLAAGLSGKPMDFAEAFKVVNAVDRLWERKKKDADINEADTKADKRTWDLLSEKVYVGTDGLGDSVYMKNAVYLEGNVRVWKSPELIEPGDSGKFDITNPRHLAKAERFGVLPATYQ